ncbi:carboxypeptidase regulatory-like domain-containing protein [Cellulomonas sp. P22]|uniref:carboxypeptidase regulatory-like domain-containing protein n=1 Tax=Cellulomonas sp. P22 TaxID=3373189 RepID=UPI0037A1A1E5
MAAGGGDGMWGRRRRTRTRGVRDRVCLILTVAVLVGTAAGCSREPEAPTVISGTVYLATGEPCTGCTLGISTRDHAMNDVGQMTGDDGSYSWEVPGAGRYTVSAFGDGTVEETVDVSAGEARTVDLTFASSDGADRRPVPTGSPETVTSSEVIVGG